MAAAVHRAEPLEQLLAVLAAQVVWGLDARAAAACAATFGPMLGMLVRSAMHVQCRAPVLNKSATRDR